jgi:hypothetical protein
MGDIVIYKKGVPISARMTIVKAKQTVKLMGADIIELEVGAQEIVPFAIGDYIEYYDHTYTLNQMPTVTKKTSEDFHYSSVVFESEQYELLDSAWLLPYNTYGDSFTGNLQDFLEIIIQNVSRNGKSWTLQLDNELQDTDCKTLTYTETNCLNVLQNLCREWGVEFFVHRYPSSATRILMVRRRLDGRFSPIKFEYGRSGGAYKIERRTNSNQNICTKLFVFGGNKNLPSDYRENKLCLPDKQRNESYITDEEAVNFYGSKENVKYFKDIYPVRYGTITGLSDNVNVFYDEGMSFNLNERNLDGSTRWLIPSNPAKIQFNSGNLAGYSFELSEYDHEAKKFKINPYLDANGLKFPNDTSSAFQFKTGDEYFIYDIRLPDAYVRLAEERLQTEGQKYFDENCKTKVSYAISISPLYLKNKYGDAVLCEFFKQGDRVHIFDFDLEVDKVLRIIGFSRNLLDPWEYDIDISDSIEYQTSFQRVVGELTDLRNLVQTNDIASAEKARRSWLALQDLINSVFDPEGNYYTEKIKPLSIETTLLAVGAKSQQFILKDVNFELNVDGNPNKVRNTAGTLEHYTIEAPDIRTWRINATATTLAFHPAGKTVEETVYYVYAKCPKTGEVGIMFYSASQFTVEETPQFYMFLVGTITTVITDSDGKRPARSIALQYGSTCINGRFINTGRIQSADGSTYIDLDDNEIGGRFNFRDGLISSVIGLGERAETSVAGLGGINMHPYDIYEHEKLNKKIAIWTNKWGQDTNLETILADTVILNDGTIKVCRADTHRPIFVADPERKEVHAARLYAGDFDAQKIKGKSIELTNGIQCGWQIEAKNNIVSREGYMEASKYYANVKLQDGSEIFAGAYTPVWVGQVVFSGGRYVNNPSWSSYVYKNGRRTGKWTITTEYESSKSDGWCRVSFSQPFPNSYNYFVTTQGLLNQSQQIDDFHKPNPAYVSICDKTAAGFRAVVTDDESTNNFHFYLQIWARSE